MTVIDKPSIPRLELRKSRIRREEVMHLSRQMAAFIRAGLPIVDAVRSIGGESENPAIRRLMTDIEDGLRRGERFSECLDRHPKIFPDFYRGIVRSAELTGKLDTVLSSLAVYLERDLEARRKIKSAAIYPAVIAAMSLVTVVVLAAYVLPKFKVFFRSLNARLPLATRMLLAVTDFMTAWAWALAILVGAIGVVVFAVLQTCRGQYGKDRLLLGIPLVGNTIQFTLVERFCRVLASMVGAGVPLPEALRVATESLHNRVYMRVLSGVAAAMLEGQGLAEPLQRTGLFPSVAAQMLRVGEETGTLDDQLELTAEYYASELEYKIKKLTAMFEPAVIVVMGVVVGFVAIALVSAMYGVFRQVKI